MYIWGRSKTGKICGSDTPIIVVLGYRKSGTRATFEERILNGDQPPDHAVSALSTPLQVNEVETYRGAISAVSMALADPSKVNTLKINTVSPTYANVTSEKYPISRPLFLPCRKPPTDNVLKYIRWALGEKGQYWIGRSFVPVGPTANDNQNN